MTDEPLHLTMFRAAINLYEARRERGELSPPEYLWLAAAKNVRADIDSKSARPVPSPNPQAQAG